MLPFRLDSSAPPGLQCGELTKVYQGLAAPALDGVSLSFTTGERVAILGRSGSGKSTLLQLLGLLDRPTAGEVFVAGEPTSDIADKDRSKLRATHYGFIFQAFHLRPYSTAVENVAAGLLYQGRERTERHRAALDALSAVGLADKAGRRPAELSGGERQRVAIARATARRPSVLLADEPTGNLDRANGDQVMAALRQIDATLIVVTHDEEIASTCDRIVRLDQGRVAP